MQLEKYGNGKGLDDLYILPESRNEYGEIIAYLESHNIRYKKMVSNLKGQSWYGKTFLVVPFGDSLVCDKLTEHMRGIDKEPTI